MDPRQQVAERAERITRKRGRLIWAQAGLFTAWQGAFFVTHALEGTRTVDHVRIWSWGVWVAALLALLLTGGGWIWGREVRRLLNDELAVHNRHEGQRWGFFAAMATALVVYGLTYAEALGARDAVHLIVTFAVGAALFRYGWLERRAEREG